MASIQFVLGCMFLFAAVFFSLNVDMTTAAPFHGGHGGGGDVLHILAAGAVVRMLMEHYG